MFDIRYAQRVVLQYFTNLTAHVHRAQHLEIRRAQRHLKYVRTSTCTFPQLAEFTKCLEQLLDLKPQ
jgi:hypothetical protein